MIEAVLSLSPPLRRRLADALETGLLAPPFTPVAIRATLGRIDCHDDLIVALSECARAGASGPLAAAWIKSLDKVSADVIPASLVWTGPAVMGLHSRSTKQVFEELVRSAKQSILISTYAYFDGPEAFKTLAARMDECFSLRVTLLLNIERERFNTTSTENLLRKFADRFWSRDWPGKARPRVYYDPRSLEAGGPQGVLHAKAVICDNERLFVTSANLTQAAMNRNIEAGILLRDRTIAQTASIHFNGLIEQGLLRPIPSV